MREDNRKDNQIQLWLEV